MPPAIPSQRDQIEAIQEAESADAPSASVISQADIDAELRRGGTYQGGKMRIFEMYQQKITAKETIKILKQEYGISGHSHTFLDGTSGYIDYSPSVGMKLRRYQPEAELKLSWTKVEKRIRQLIQEGSYLSPAELEKYQSDHLETAQEAEASAPVLLDITDMDVDKLLVEDWGITGRKQRIFTLYRQGLSDEQIAEHLRLGV